MKLYQKLLWIGGAAFLLGFASVTPTKADDVYLPDIQTKLPSGEQVTVMKNRDGRITSIQIIDGKGQIVFVLRESQ